MTSYILGFQEIDITKLAKVGGKGANLGELSRMNGIQVPEGFCVTTEAYEEITGNNEELNSLLDQLSLLNSNIGDISESSAKIHTLVETIAIPKKMEVEIIGCVSKLGKTNAYAVRSSATAEDLPTSSFAGQHDTYLNIIGDKAILKHISKCWASLFTERAVTYRLQNGFDHHKVRMSVIVQKMVFPQAAGILFTADPVSSHRKVLSIDAGFGFGEALVSGRVSADNYRVQSGKIIDKKISTKKLALYASRDGGLEEQAIEPERQKIQALTDEQIVRLDRAGRKIEEHFGRPQDIEWCLADDSFYIVQSRPITTLYPIPDVKDQDNHVYVSVGHQQMMTDAMKPLGISVWQFTAARPMSTAGGRLFVDITSDLASPAKRNIVVNVLGKSDPLFKDAIMTILERVDFIPSFPDEMKDPGPGAAPKAPPSPDFQTLQDYDPSVVSDLIQKNEASMVELEKNIHGKSGPALIDFILEDIHRMKKIIFDPQSSGVIMTAMNAASWINEHIQEWLGEKNVVDTLSQSIPNNVTAEMGLALLDIADVIRPYPDIITYLEQARDDDFLDELLGFDGGREVRNALSAFLDKFGMRCAGEIDITRTRWSEKPTTLIPLILSNIKNFQPGVSKRKFEQGRGLAVKKEQELLDRLRKLPVGEEKARETKRLIDLIRNLSGYREYPKYSIVSRFSVYKQALLREAERLVQAGVIPEREDIFYLKLEELQEVVHTHESDYRIITKRKDEYKSYERLTPPRVFTSDGEIIRGVYKREDLPAEALIGLAVSSGVVEGRARVIFNMEDADLEVGDILVTSFTDPGWTPLFVCIKGLVTEVGGLMTHGAVIAREYGLPAVVNVENATRLIKDGERIRVDGTQGYIEIL